MLIGSLLLLLMLMVGFWYFGRKPAIHRELTDRKLERLLKVLLYQGYDGGVLFIRGTKSTPFIQVMKYAGGKGVGLQLDFPRADWSLPYRTVVEHLLTKRGARFEQHDPEGLVFCSQDFGTNVAEAATVAKSILEEVFGVRLETEGRAYFQNVSANPNARIGFE